MSIRVSWNGLIIDYNGFDLYGGFVILVICNVVMFNIGIIVRGLILSGFLFFII